MGLVVGLFVVVGFMVLVPSICLRADIIIVVKTGGMVVGLVPDGIGVTRGVAVVVLGLFPIVGIGIVLIIDGTVDVSGILVDEVTGGAALVTDILFVASDKLLLPVNCSNNLSRIDIGFCVGAIVVLNGTVNLVEESIVVVISGVDDEGTKSVTGSLFGTLVVKGEGVVDGVNKLNGVVLPNSVFIGVLVYLVDMGDGVVERIGEFVVAGIAVVVGASVVVVWDCVVCTRTDTGESVVIEIVVDRGDRDSVEDTKFADLGVTKTNLEGVLLVSPLRRASSLPRVRFCRLCSEAICSKTFAFGLNVVEGIELRDCAEV